MYYIGLDVLRAIALAKKKNDRIDAGKIADCLRCDFLPECHMAPTAIRDRRRVLRYRNLVIKQSVQMKNRVSGLRMETGVSYNKQRLHKVGYFRDLLSHNEEVSDSIRPLLKICREQIERSQRLDYALVSRLERLRTADQRGFDHGSNLGSGDRRRDPVPIDQRSDQLLRVVW